MDLPSMDETLLGDRSLLIEKRGEGVFKFLDYRIALADSSSEIGEGLFALEDIPKGTVVWNADFKGETTMAVPHELVLDEDAFFKRFNMTVDDWITYAWFIQQKYWHGPKLQEGNKKSLRELIKADATNFFNHSCNPNVVYANDCAMIAWKDIKKGEPVTYDYSTSEICPDIYGSFVCLCGSENCRKVVHGHDYRLPEVRERYAGHFLSSVQMQIEKECSMGEGPCRQLNRNIERRDHPIKFIGKGLFAKYFIPKGATIWKCCGFYGNVQQYTIAEFQAMEENELKSFIRHYGYQVEDDLLEAPINLEETEREYSWFMNHSCDPTTIIWRDDEWIASRDIHPGEEITYDYCTTETIFDRLPDCCACGSHNCRGKVTKDDYMNVDVQARYLKLNAFAPHIRFLLKASATTA